MRIINPGKKPEERIIRNICPYCKCEFEWMAIEGSSIADPRDGNYIQIPCPKCGTMCYDYNSIKYPPTNR